LPLALDFVSGVGAGALLDFGADEDWVAAGLWETGFLRESLATGCFEGVAGFLAGVGFLATGAFLAGGVFFEAGWGAGFEAGFLTGFGRTFFAAGFFAGAAFFGAGAFLAGFVLEIEREELVGEDLDLVFKRLSVKSFTLGQKAIEDQPFEFSGQGFVFEFFGAPP
jgi:hypothetical protein